MNAKTNQQIWAKKIAQFRKSGKTKEEWCKKKNITLCKFAYWLFVFCNKNRNKLKILQWHHNGFWLHYRRLERGVFRWPKETRDSPLILSSRELQWLLDGLSLVQTRAHKKVAASLVV
jgi:transposase